MSISQRLAERVVAARNGRFVGRDAEKSLFRSAIVARELPFYLLYVFGPGGVGKTTLIREFARLCDQESVRYVYVDGRNAEPSPEPFISLVARTMSLQSSESPAEAMASR